MLILNWNIKWGGVNLEKEIVNEITKWTADLVTLPEYKKNSSGKKIEDYLKNYGYDFHISSSVDPKKNGVGVFSKEKIYKEENEFEDKNNVCVFKYNDFTFISTFCANDEVTKRFIRDIEKRGKKDKTIIIGDINTGPRGSMPDRYEDLDRIVRVGYVDVWRKKKKEICWSFQFGKGKSQPDHALVSEDISIEAVEIEFDLLPIKKNLSDHGIMFLKIWV